MIRIAVLDDHPAVLGGLQRVVERAPDLEPVAFVESERALRDALRVRHADVVVLDYDLTRGNGLAVCQQLKARRLASRAAGVDGLVHKSEPVADLLAVVRRVAQGERVLPALQPELRSAAMSRLDDEDVSVAAMLLGNASHDAIADILEMGREEVAQRARRIVARMRPNGVGPEMERAPHGAAIGER
jgi:DNA-binding NarL/FixJ family response regulator